MLSIKKNWKINREKCETEHSAKKIEEIVLYISIYRPWTWVLNILRCCSIHETYLLLLWMFSRWMYQSKRVSSIVFNGTQHSLLTSYLFSILMSVSVVKHTHAHTYRTCYYLYWGSFDAAYCHHIFRGKLECWPPTIINFLSYGNSKRKNVLTLNQKFTGNKIAN